MEGKGEGGSKVEDERMKDEGNYGREERDD